MSWTCYLVQKHVLQCKEGVFNLILFNKLRCPGAISTESFMNATGSKSECYQVRDWYVPLLTLAGSVLRMSECCHAE